MVMTGRGSPLRWNAGDQSLVSTTDHPLTGIQVDDPECEQESESVDEVFGVQLVGKAALQVKNRYGLGAEG